MAYGDGSITRKRKGVYEVQVPFGKNPVTGKRERVTQTVYGSRADAIKARDRLRLERDSGIVADGAKMTFEKLAQSWLESRQREGLSASTLRTDKYVTRDLCELIGQLKLSEITPHTVEVTLNEFARQHTEKRGKAPSGSKMSKLYQHFSQIMQRAVDHDLIMRNPVDRIKSPQFKRLNERNALDREQAANLLQCLNGAESAEYAAFKEKEQRRKERGADADERAQVFGLSNLSCIMGARIGLATGERYGEILGLTWEHVNLSSGVIHIVQSLEHYTNEIKKPKTKSSVRSIAIDGETVKHLKQWRAFQLSVLSEFGVTMKSHAQTPVCCSNVGDFMTYANFNRWWRKWREENGFSGVKFHELRHTQATHMLANGIDVKTAQARLGHSSASTTLDMYAHALPENDRKAAELIGDLFNSKPLSVMGGDVEKRAI